MTYRHINTTLNTYLSHISLLKSIRSGFILAGAVLIILASTTTTALAEVNDVVFPHDYKLGKHYATVTRGSTREELYTSEKAISAVNNNHPFPDGTVIIMEDYRNDELYRYIVMEKRTGWAASDTANTQAGDWKFQWFNPDRSVRGSESLQRCRNCHASQPDSDYVFTANQMKNSN